MKRKILLISYILLLFLLFMLLLAADLVDRPENPFTATDAIPFAVWAIVFAGHHILSFLHLRRNHKAFSFQVYCILMDLVFLWDLLRCDYFPPKEWMLLWVIGLRMGSLLLCVKEDL